MEQQEQYVEDMLDGLERYMEGNQISEDNHSAEEVGAGREGNRYCPVRLAEALKRRGGHPRLTFRWYNLGREVGVCYSHTVPAGVRFLHGPIETVDSGLGRKIEKLRNLLDAKRSAMKHLFL